MGYYLTDEMVAELRQLSKHWNQCVFSGCVTVHPCPICDDWKSYPPKTQH